jgi:hypothetical protein
VIAGLLGRATFDPLGYLALSAREIERLAVTYAPTLEIETRADYDRFGWLRWRRGVPIPQVDAAEPTVYVQAAYTRYREHLLVQLVYTLWFSERPARDNFELGAGPLDGVVWRVTSRRMASRSSTIRSMLAAAFMLSSRRHGAGREPALQCRKLLPQSPRTNARGDARQRQRTRSRACGFRATPKAWCATPCGPYDELRSIPRLTGGPCERFGPDGRIAGSAARQWGRQTIGRYHFDDGDLLERRFELEL